MSFDSESGSFKTRRAGTREETEASSDHARNFPDHRRLCIISMPEQWRGQGPLPLMRTVCGVRGQPPPLPEQEAAAACTPVPTQTFPGSPVTNSSISSPEGVPWGSRGWERSRLLANSCPRFLVQHAPLAGRPKCAALLQPVCHLPFFPWCSHIQKREPHASEVCFVFWKQASTTKSLLFFFRNLEGCL